MKGLVLCGGLSSRMGSDKGLLKTDEINWAQRANQLLNGFNQQVYVSIHENQLPEYKSFFNNQNLLIDAPLALKGPLIGLLTAHLQFPQEDWMVLACDMINMDAFVLNILMKHYLESNQNENLVFKEHVQLHPLCGIYTANNLNNLMTLLKQNKLVKFSMHYALSLGATKEIMVEADWSSQFLNVNSRDEMEGSLK